MTTKLRPPIEEHEIFHDPTGKRWKIIKMFALLLVTAVGLAIFYYVPRILTAPKVTPFQIPGPLTISTPSNMRAPPPQVLASQLETVNVPIIGTGPLVRVDQIAQTKGQTIAVEAYANRVTKVLTHQEILAVGDNKYAIERFGSGANKKIALTFDDGPDEVYSPQILDILSKQNMPSTFFLIGSNVVRHPGIAERMAREGHTVGNHTFDHVNFDLQNAFQSKQQINQTGRVIRAATHYDSSFFRLPYGGPNDQAMRDTLRGILFAQQQGYIITSFTFDTKDYEKHKNLPPMPSFDGTNIVMLLHDGGGDRSRTIAYLKKLGPVARAHGYTFVNLSELYPQTSPLAKPVRPSTLDNMSYTGYRAFLVWPHDIIGVLFIFSAVTIILNMCVNMILATLQKRRSAQFKRRPKGYNPLVSVIVPAYNEEVVLKKTVQSLLRSRYRNIEILIVDDGSKDGTWKEAKKIARSLKKVRSYTQPNAGKATALNNGIHKAKGEILICIDADTLFPPDAISKLVRHFADPSVGAVAGSVKVGNLINTITHWQALEYTVGIYLERAAQAFMGAIIVVPGACGAWRKEAIVKAGGFSLSTLAEDCDLTLAIHKAGYKILQDNAAHGYTEVPQSYRTLGKQRFRWIFGNLQTYWKHRDIMFHRKYSWLGMLVLPYVMFNILLPFIFIPVLLSLMIENIASAQYGTIALFAGLTLLIQFLVAVAGITLAREKYRLLFFVPLTRLIYSPLKTYVLFRTALTALKGARVGWNKLQRTGSVRYPRLPERAHRAANTVRIR